MDNTYAAHVWRAANGTTHETEERAREESRRHNIATKMRERFAGASSAVPLVPPLPGLQQQPFPYQPQPPAHEMSLLQYLEDPELAIVTYREICDLVDTEMLGLAPLSEKERVAYREAAKEIYGGTKHCFEEEALVVRNTDPAEEGAYVACVVWVDKKSL